MRRPAHAKHSLMDPFNTTLNPEAPGTVNEKGVLFGHNGFLFFARTAGQAVRWYQSFSDQQIDDIRATILARQGRAANLGAHYAGVLQPAKSSTLTHVYPAKPPACLSDHPRFADTLLDTAAPRLRAIGEPCFWKTDAHLAPRGAIEMAIVIARASGLVDAAALQFIEKSLPNLLAPRDTLFVGETGMRCSPPRGETGSRFAPAIGIQAAAYDGKADFTQKHPQEGDLVLAFSPDALIDKTLIVFGTSFVNAYIGPLAHIFSKVIWARTQRYIYWDVVEACKSDAVISLVQSNSAHDIFPVDDSETPSFMAISKHTGRTMHLRDGNPHLFADMLPGLMANTATAKPASKAWMDHVVGVKGYQQDPIRPRFVSQQPIDPTIL